ncbi:HAD family hydrolase [Vibrio tritonius]|uniref:HAD family hydrolase n=1 Tax=Vibrio tritonius TaxID=1435069 RepID=UPI0008386F3F|nr:HAD family phosphatase [Vibrio tritonius]
MASSSFKNVVFDIGNVLVRWNPVEITRLTFDDSYDIESLAESIFRSEIWYNLNKGLISENEAKLQHQILFGLSEVECERLFYYVRQTQILIYGSVDLVKRVKKAGYRVFALTDNVHEIVAHLKSTYTFWELFEGTVVSADVCILKPQAEIYQHLLNQFEIKAEETIFLDDMPHNVKGAQDVGITAIEFKNAAQGEQALKALGLDF